MAVPKHKKYNNSKNTQKKIKLLGSRSGLITKSFVVYPNYSNFNIFQQSLVFSKKHISLNFKKNSSFLTELFFNSFNLSFFFLKKEGDSLESNFFFDSFFLKKIEIFFFNLCFNFKLPLNCNKIYTYYLFFFNYFCGSQRVFKKKKIKLTLDLFISIFYFLKETDLLKKKFEKFFILSKYKAEFIWADSCRYFNYFFNSQEKISPQATISLFFDKIIFSYLFNFRHKTYQYGKYNLYYNYYFTNNFSKPFSFSKRVWFLNDCSSFKNKFMCLSVLFNKEYKNNSFKKPSFIFFLDFCQK